MSNDSFQKLWETLRREALSSTEKAAIRTRLIEAMKNPYMPKKSPYWSVFSFHYSSYVGAFAVAILVFSVSFAAEYALPGSTLYAVKRNINEPLISATTLSSEGKALWQVSLAERRLFEATQLLSEDRLSDTDTEVLGTAIRESVSAFAKALERTDADDKAVGLSSQFEATLAAHEGFLNAYYASKDISIAASMVSEDSARAAGVSLMQVAPAHDGPALPTPPVPEVALMKAAPVSVPGGLVGDIQSAFQKVNEIRSQREDKVKGKSAEALLSIVKARKSDVEDRFDEVSKSAQAVAFSNSYNRISEHLVLAESLLMSVQEVSSTDATVALELLRQAESHLIETEILIRNAKRERASIETTAMVFGGEKKLRSQGSDDENRDADEDREYDDAFRERRDR